MVLSRRQEFKKPYSGYANKPDMRRSWELPVHVSSMSESINPIPEEPPEPLCFSIDLQPVEDLVPEHDRSPEVISVDLLNVKDILPRIPAAVPTPSDGKSTRSPSSGTTS